VLRSGLHRLAVLLVVIAALTAAVSVVLGALAHARQERALAGGGYIVGVAILVGSFVLGVRGPLRADWGDVTDQPRPGMLGGGFRRRVRASTPEERVEARRNSLALFGLGIVFIVIGGLVDPTRRVL
jgi:hypothetical protein